MTLQGRDLQQGMTGSDVAELQKELNSVSYTVPATESQASSFGAGTLAAVQKFQTAKGLQATGVVDAATAAALTAAVTAITYVVSGRVSSPVSAALSGLTAQLVDKNVGGDLVLTSVTTDSNGLYSISIAIDPSILQKNNKTQPDLQVKILNGTTFLAASLVAYNAPQNLTLNVTLPANVTGLPSEYEALSASISANYGGTLTGLQENSQQQDITFLANKTGWDARAVALAALATQFAQLSAPPLSAPAQVPAAPAAPAAPATPGTPPATGTAPAAPANVSLAPEFYYALFRAGLPADSNSLFGTPSQTVQNIWQQAIQQGVIPQALSAQVPAAVTTYQALATAYLLTATPAVGISTLGEMLTVSKLTAAQQTTFSQVCAQSGSDPTTFWNAVSAQLGAAATKQLQLDGQLFYLTLNNAPLVTALHTAETTLASPQDLVSLGYYNAAKWIPLIGTTTIPPQIAGQSAANYANFLAAQIRLSFPTAVAGDQVKVGVFPITDSAAVASEVSAFLTANSSQFFIGAEPVEAYVKRTSPAGATTAVVSQIKRLQRVYQLTADDQSMSALLRHNIDSAYAITRYGAAGFQRAFQNELGSDNTTAIYSRAQHVYSSVMNLTLGYLGSRQSPVLGGNQTLMSGFPSAPANQPYPIIAYPTLESLFGSLDYCTCEDCRSILSPAAYLVDLLHYLDQPSPSPGFMNPQQVLFQRRPDLQYLPLTCENTNTALPYIDVVNETLEYYVANGLSLANFQGYSTDDTVTSAELIACPQFTNDAAYAVLQNAFFPPPLPFNRPLAQLRQLFQNMGATLPDVMAALRTSTSAAISPTGTGYSAGDVCLEYLGISRDEYRVFTDGTLTFQELYGYPGTETLAQLQSISLQDYSRRTGVSYDDLVSILETQFINPNAILIERLERLQASFATLQALNANPSQTATFIAGLPAGLDATAYGGSAPTDYAAVAAWVINAANFTRISNIITLSNPTNNPDECSGTSFEFSYLNGSPLTATDFVKLIRFIRLWQKLGLTIEQTDNLLTALYPAADLPSGNNDTVNLPLLNSGFKVALLRMGVLFQVMDRLSLTASNSLGPLLACWSNIGTVGDNALYQQMFGGPAIQREDPGAPIATIGGAPNAGDTLLTTINGVTVSQLVKPGDTPSTVATNIATAINKTTTPDPTTLLPLNQRISASSQGAVVTIRAGFTLAWGPTADFAVKTATQLLQSAVFVGAVAAGTPVTVQINTVSISYSMQATDTAASVAAGLANAINNSTSPDPYSGQPLNSLLVATSSGAVITVSSINSGAPLSLNCSVTPGATGTYNAGTQVPAYQTATVGGTVAAGDVLTTTINGLNIPFAVTTQNSAAAVASAMVATINVTTNPDPVTGMPINNILHASANGATVSISANDPAMALSLSYAATGAMTYVSSGQFATSQTATVAGSFSIGCVLSTTINGVTVTYTVAGTDTAASIAGNIATAINATTTIDSVTNVPLNQLVSASAAGGILTIAMKQNTGSFNLALWVQSGTYTAGVQTPPFADNGYGDFLSDASQTIFGHEPVLRAAFNLTGAEFSVIAGVLQFTPTTPLTLSNISSLFRIGWFAHTLNISVVEFLGLWQMTGLDAFAPLDLNPAPPPVDPPVLRFIALVQAMANAGLQPVQALYLLWNQDLSGKSTPDVSVVTGLASALRAAFAAVAAQFTIQSDPDGTIAQSLMALVYGNTATNFYFGLLNNTLVTQISYPNNSYPNPQPAPVQSVLDASGGRLSYDNLGKQLSFAGVLDPATKAAIQAAITANQNVQALLDALGDLAVANQQMVGPFFATYPELLPLYTAYASSTNPLQQKRSALLASFLPTLIQKRNQEQALATVTAAAGSDPSFANVLLEDATILHGATDLTAPIANDLTALNNPGLAAQIFLSNALSGQPDIVLDADPASYAPSTIGAQQTATVSGKVTAGDVLKTVINNVPISYTVVAADHTVADVAAGIAAATAATATTDPFSGLPLKNVIDASASGGVVTFQASNAGTNLSLNPSVTPAAAPPTYSAGAQVPASQSATVAGASITVGDVLTTTINTIAVSYTVVASDTSVAILAAHIASAINAVATADPASGKPLNQVVSATSAGGVVTVTASIFGPDLTVTCSLSAGATETYTPGASNNASQTATLSALLPANDVVVTAINSVAVQYTVAAADTTLTGLVANVAAAINANTTVDSVTNKPLNAIVTASSAAGTLTITTIAPGVPFTLSCSLSLGAYTLNGQVAILQSATVSGGINTGDVISTTINGTTVNYNVAGTETRLSALAANIVAAVNAAAAVNTAVTATSLGSCIIFRSTGSSAFSLICSTSSQAAVSYSTGPQFPAWEATVSGGFFANDVLTTNINDTSVTYTVAVSGATPAAIAAAVVAAVNASAAIDPLTGLPVNGLVSASSSGATVIFRSAGPALVISCSLSAGATENYAIAGELPARPGGGPIAGIWSGYIEAPQDGFYNIEIDTDPGAAVTLSVDGTPVSMTPSANTSVWNNQGPISLTAGELVPIKLTATSLQSALSLNWQSTGLGWQTIPATDLYSDTLIDRLQTAYVRFLKVTALATELSLTADEIAFLGTSNNYAVNTTDARDNTNAGSATFTPASMANIDVYPKPVSKLVMDTGPAQEVVSVTATTTTTFTALTVNAHNGTGTPFPIVDYPNVSTGQGWLNFLTVSPIAGSSTSYLQPAPSYAAGPQTFAQQTATVANTVTAGNALTTTINGVASGYKFVAGDTLPSVAQNMAAAINANTNPDPVSGLPLNQAFSASSAGPVITVTALIFGPDFTMTCSVSAGATCTYTRGAFVPASQTAIVSGVSPQNSVLITSFNGVAVQYTVSATDTTAAGLAAKVAAAINATTALDPISNLPINKLVNASNSAGTITITTISPGAPLTIGCSVASFRDVLRDVLTFARIKAAVSPNDEQLLDVLENPLLLSADGVTPQFIKLTGWSLVSLDSLLVQFFGNTKLTNLSVIENLRKVYDAYGFVTSCRISAAALLAATTNAPSPATVASLQSALRSLYAASDWLNVIQPVNDTMRIQQRDALVAYILQQLGDQYASSLLTLPTTADGPAGSITLTFGGVAGVQVNMGVQGFNIPPNTTVSSIAGNIVTISQSVSADVPQGSSIVFVPMGSLNIATADNLFEDFLIDVETQPPVQTSRIRLALSSVQLFIERILRNLEPQIQPTDIDGSLWTWMKRYRVWQANREVFLWPENWLYPELRDDQSPIFQQMMSALLQSDITDDAASAAYLDYLSNLELVAKLEPCGLYYVPASGDSDEAAYVVARTAGAHRKYYFRELQYGSWTPWTEIQIDCEDMPITPIVWNGRLMLFWLKVTKTSSPQTPNGTNSTTTVTSLTLNDLQNYGANSAAAQTQNNVTVSAVLCWSEYYNGKWQQQKSSDVNRPTVIGTYNTSGEGSFDPNRNLLQIVPVSVPQHYGELDPLSSFGVVQSTLPPDALILSVYSPISSSPSQQYYGGFVVYNTHSLPVRWDDLCIPVFYALITAPQYLYPYLRWLVLPSTPGRTFQPIEPYTGGGAYDSKGVSIGPFSISYWTLTNPGLMNFGGASFSPAFQNSLFGLNRVPRTVDSACSQPQQFPPFFFEDRRNVFYVTTTQSTYVLLSVSNYGYGVFNTNAASTYTIPGLSANSIPFMAQTTPFLLPTPTGGDSSVVGRYLQQGGNIKFAIGTVTSISYQGTALYPGGQVINQAAATFTSVTSKNVK